MAETYLETLWVNETAHLVGFFEARRPPRLQTAIRASLRSRRGG